MPLQVPAIFHHISMEICELYPVEGNAWVDISRLSYFGCEMATMLRLDKYGRTRSLGAQCA